MCFWKKELEKRNRYSKEQMVGIYPLSPSDRLDESTDVDKDYSTYEECLKEVFLRPELHNVAITGNYGVGKSSVIRTFERRRNSRRLTNRHFLYISLTNFHTNGFLKTEAGNQESSFKKKLEELERDLLCQILYVCDDIQRVPGITYRLIPSPKSWLGRHIPIVMLMLLVLGLFCIAYGSQLSVGMESFLPTGLTAWWKARHQALVAVPYGLVLFCLLFFARKLAIWLSSGAHLSKLTLEGTGKVAGVDKIGVDIQPVEGTSYLDRHGFELIYVLERMAGRFDYTVVFEDMDRLGTDVQRELFSELREINCLANSRLSHKQRGLFRYLGSAFPRLGKFAGVGHLFREPCLRFLYVAHDMAFTPTECSKFFDYILPVIPTISGESLPDRLAETYLKNVGIELDEHSTDESQRPSILLACAAPELNDYRTIHTILNEYQVFERVEKQRGLLLTQKDKRELFAYVTYKNLCPDDYYKIRAGESLAFPPEPRQGNESFSKLGSSLVRNWLEKGFLPWDCIMFAGYSLTWLGETYRAVLQSTNDSRKRNLLQSCADGHFRQQHLCADILLNILNDEMFQQAIDGIQFSLLLYLLQVMPINISKSEMANFEKKLQSLLERANRAVMSPNRPYEGRREQNAKGLETWISRRFDLLSPSIRLELLHYLLLYGYRPKKLNTWLFRENAGKDEAAETWIMLGQLTQRELETLLYAQKEAAFQWLKSPGVLEGIRTAGEDSKMLSLVKMMVPPGERLSPEIGEMKFTFREREIRSLQRWLDNVY